jgi:hypothetical protein
MEALHDSHVVLYDTSWSCKYNGPCDLAQMDIFDNSGFILKSQCIVVKVDKSGYFLLFFGGGGISSIFLCTFFFSFVFLCANFSPTGYIANLSTRCNHVVSLSSWYKIVTHNLLTNCWIAGRLPFVNKLGTSSANTSWQVVEIELVQVCCIEHFLHWTALYHNITHYQTLIYYLIFIKFIFKYVSQIANNSFFNSCSFP